MKSDFKLFQAFKLAMVTLLLLAILQRESPFTTVYILAFVLFVFSELPVFPVLPVLPEFPPVVLPLSYCVKLYRLIKSFSLVA